MIPVLIAIGAAIGAPARYLTDRVIQSHHGSVFPWGTLTVNLAASVILGMITGASGHLSANAEALIGTGLCGTLSTFSTFSYETMQLVRNRSGLYAAANVLLGVVAGLCAAALGWYIGASIT